MQLLHAGNGRDGGRRADDPLHDDQLFLVGGVVHQHLHHEAVYLRLGQRVGAFGFDRVLGRHHQKGGGQGMGFTGDGDLAFLHRLQQRTLHLGGRAVDLIRQQQVGEHGAQRGAEVTGFLVVDTGSHQVGGHQVGRELDTFELALHRLRQGLDGQGFGQARHPFDQQMALRQHGHHHAFKKAVLPDHHPFDLEEDLLHQCGGLGGVGWGGHVHGAPVGVKKAACLRHWPRSRWEPQSRCQ